MSQAKTSKADNQAKAPEAAKFVEEMRSVFGEVKVMYVREGRFEIGAPTTEMPK